MLRCALLATVLLIPVAGVRAGEHTDGLAEAVSADYSDHLGALFEHFHRNPELSFLEHETSKRLAAELRAAGIDEVIEGVGGTGVVAMLRNGDGPVLLRERELRRFLRCAITSCQGQIRQGCRARWR